MLGAAAGAGGGGGAAGLGGVLPDEGGGGAGPGHHHGQDPAGSRHPGPLQPRLQQAPGALRGGHQEQGPHNTGIIHMMDTSSI